MGKESDAAGAGRPAQPHCLSGGPRSLAICRGEGAGDDGPHSPPLDAPLPAPWAERPPQRRGRARAEARTLCRGAGRTTGPQWARWPRVHTRAGACAGRQSSDDLEMASTSAGDVMKTLPTSRGPVAPSVVSLWRDSYRPERTLHPPLPARQPRAFQKWVSGVFGIDRRRVRSRQEPGAESLRPGSGTQFRTSAHLRAGSSIASTKPPSARRRVEARAQPVSAVATFTLDMRKDKSAFPTIVVL
jgi:hypothetical protein